MWFVKKIRPNLKQPITNNVSLVNIDLFLFIYFYVPFCFGFLAWNKSIPNCCIERQPSQFYHHSFTPLFCFSILSKINAIILWIPQDFFGKNSKHKNLKQIKCKKMCLCGLSQLSSAFSLSNINIHDIRGNTIKDNSRTKSFSSSVPLCF